MRNPIFSAVRNFSEDELLSVDGEFLDEQVRLEAIAMFA